jgi:hypothetical protein
LLVKSHIIPRSFFEIEDFHQKAPEKTLSILSDFEEFKPIRRPVGIYDEDLFCNECESKFMKYDDYAFKLLIEKRHLRKPQMDETGRKIGEYYDAYDYDMLKLFFMSVLLRASLSEDFFFQHVKLGPYIEDLKKSVDSGDAKSPDFFAVFLSYYAQIKSGPVIFPPAPQRIDNVKFYHFHVGRVICYIKVDKRKTPSNYVSDILKPSAKLFLRESDIRDSNADGILRRAIKNPMNSNYFST